MALTLDATGSVTALTIVDSACVEANGTYDLIFTGANTTAATGTYTILGNVITAVSLTSGGSGYAAAPTVATQTADGSITATFVSFAASQDLQSRHPLVEITSSQRLADIPFDGSFLTGETYNEFGPNLIPHSTGRLCLAYCYGPDADSDCGIKYAYTDTDRLEYTTVTIELYTTSSYTMVGCSICEMTDGNIGLVYLVNDGVSHVYRLLRRIITVTGTAVSNAEIANWSHDTFTSDPWVSAIGSNSYLLVYGKKSGSDYYIYKRTSSNFTTWSSESALSIGGLTSTMRLSNPSMLKISTGDIWLWFDVLESVSANGDELTNIYYSISADGSTWSTATKWSAYTAYSEVATHPVAIQKVANQMQVMFTRKVGALHMTSTAPVWPDNDPNTNASNAKSVSFDSVNRKLYVVNYGFGNAFESVVRIDVDTWECDKYWDSTTTPAIPAYTYGSYQNYGHHVVLLNTTYFFAIHLDGEADSVTGYYFYDYVGLGITANVTHDLVGGTFNERFSTAKYDGVNDRIWITLGKYYSGRLAIGYLDMAETSDYEFHRVITDDSFYGSIYGGTPYFAIDSAGSRIIAGHCSAGTPGLKWWDLTTGALISDLISGTDVTFPHYGVRDVFVYGDFCYTSLGAYTSGYSQEDFRGLMEVNLLTEQITYYRPTYCTEDNHYFSSFVDIGENKIAMRHEGYGIAIFDTVSKTWELFSNDNISGLTFDGTDYWYQAQGALVYDSVNEMLYAGDFRGQYDDGGGVVAFSTYGYIRQSYYSIGAYSGGAWSFGTAAQLTQGYRDYDAGACVEPDSTSSAYVFWTNEDTEAEKSIKWDKDGSTVDISPYIVGEVSQEMKIDGNAHTLSFSVSHGHLFDPYNSQSLLSTALKKGRKLALRWGESINSMDYWQECGEYYVVSGSMSFQRGEYPIFKVDAEDQRTLWQHGHVYATPAYNNTPEEILADLATDIAGIAVGDQNVPAMTGSTDLQMQWIETTLDEIFTQICERFGYYFRFDYQGKLSVRQITNAASIDHTYTDNTKLLDYSPDDKYSDFTNRVTVRGQELDWTTVQYDEERITQLSGTLGWWGCDAEHVVWFSDDKSRRCIYPRLIILETATSIPFQLAGDVHESIEECGALDDNKFCTVYVEAPNLIPLLAAAIALYIVGNKVGDAVAAFVVGWTVPVGRLIEGLAIMPALMILGSTANYQIEVWATPLGSIRRSCQASWNDTEHQTEINAIVEQVIDDPLCYSAADCQTVANFEGMVAQMQRKRVKIKKIAHLQDEDGDTIRVVHPYSGDNFDLYIASLKRTFKKAEAAGEGYFFDEIEGWNIA